MRRNQNRRRPRRQNQAPKGGSITTVRFHRLNAVTTSGVTGIVTYPLNPQSTQFGALSSVGDQFDLFRVTDLEYRIHPCDPTNTTYQVACFVPDVDVQTATATQLSESPSAAVQTPFSGVPSWWSRVPKSQLKGMLDWYKCTADAGAAEFESQGLLYIAAGLADTVYFEVRGIMQFKNPVSTVIMIDRIIDKAVKSGSVVRIPQVPTAPANPVTNGFVVLPQLGCTKNFS